MDEATPRPWSTEVRTGAAWWITPPEGIYPNVIAQTAGGNDEANAELIVKAVNQHDELVELAEQAFHIIRRGDPKPGKLMDDGLDWLKKVRASGVIEYLREVDHAPD